MTTKYTTRHLAAAGLIAAAYVTLCAAFPALSYGPIQVRFSEVFTLLPVFSPVAIWGVGIGCMLANIYGLAVGTNIIGVWDILFGTAATVIAAVLTYRWRDIRFRGLPVLSALAPVLLNALIIGAELTATCGSICSTSVPPAWASSSPASSSGCRWSAISSAPASPAGCSAPSPAGSAADRNLHFYPASQLRERIGQTKRPPEGGRFCVREVYE